MRFFRFVLAVLVLVPFLGARPVAAAANKPAAICTTMGSLHIVLRSATITGTEALTCTTASGGSATGQGTITDGQLTARPTNLRLSLVTDDTILFTNVGLVRLVGIRNFVGGRVVTDVGAWGQQNNDFLIGTELGGGTRVNKITSNGRETDITFKVTDTFFSFGEAPLAANRG